jgi:peptidyl-prolyl cis-trans isomerase SurA
MIVMKVLARWVVVLAATAAFCGGFARAEVLDEIVAKVNDDIITKSDLETEEQGLLQELYRRHSGTELDAQVADAKKQLLRRMIDHRVLAQKATHLFDMTKMQDYYLEMFKSQQNIASDKDLEKLLAAQNMTLADWKKRLVDDLSPQQVIKAEISERIAVSEKDERAYYEAHATDFEIPAEATVREIVLKASGSERAAKLAAAEAVRARLLEPGADFASIATEVSDAGTKNAGGLLGTVKKGDLAAALEAAAFTVPVGEVSQVIEADYGFHILKVDARTEASSKPFDTVKGEIEKKLQEDRFSVEYQKYMIKAWTEATIWISPKYQDRLAPIEPLSGDSIAP